MDPVKSFLKFFSLYFGRIRIERDNTAEAGEALRYKTACRSIICAAGRFK
jgi:hypothetical protein